MGKSVIRYITLSIIPIYWISGILGGRGSSINTIIVLVWLLLCAYSMYLHIKKGYNSIGSVIIIFVFLNAIYYFCSPRMVPVDGILVSTTESLKRIIQAMTMYFPFYVFIKKGIISDSDLKREFVIVFVVFICHYFFSLYSKMEYRGQENVTNNVGYFFVMIFPFSFIFFRQKLISFCIFLISLFLVLMSAKRGAIICMVGESALFYYYFKKTISKKYKTLFKCLSFIVFFLIVFWAYNYVMSSDYLLNRLNKTIDGDSSNRDIIYSSIFKYCLEGNLLELLFGHGFMYSSSVPGNFTGLFAHHDWLELFVGLGILGVVVYAYFLLRIYSQYFHDKRIMPDSLRFAILCIMFVWTIKPFFSMTYYSVNTFCLSMELGIIMAKLDEIKINNYER